ncbi:glycosyltransferase [Pontibacter sp. 172403-2]|uniref:glycosyltransferase n=1 Tax=Pontibacter rufus TaxID=2791028 RepID=UPI0018AF5C56|nr:glycosyltransferase [Pontibacter sp. 172403-2]MBF9252540.1 glycosyltransferase [Pontibacter sp. 172403-2]
MDQKKALHINSYFLSNKIHYNFFKEIIKYRQDKFLIPVYKHFKENHIEGMDIDYVFSGIDKKVFFTKVFRVLYLIYKKKLNRDADYIHGHTLISDGIPAYLLSRIIKKEFVVSVRSTDVDYFIARSSVFRSIAKKILTNASMVFLVSPSHEQRIKNLYPELVNKKFFLLPNGIDNFWIKNLNEGKLEKATFETVNILFVGQIIKRKRLDLLIDFIQKFDDRRYNLTIVGKNSLELDFDEISRSINNGNSVNYIGEVKDSNELLQIYRKNDIFVLLSYSETFGVVYIEALSQKLPIIYTRGDGIDGYFEEGEVGYSCDHESLDELKEKVDLTLSQYKRISMNTTKKAKLFEWDHLVKQYMNNINTSL